MKNFLKEMVDGQSKKKRLFLTFLLVAVFLLLPFNHAQAGVMESLVEALGVFFADILKTVLWGVVATLVGLGAYLVDVFLDPTLYEAVFAQTVIGPGMQTIRDFCNMFFIFFMLLIAFGTIVRSSTYNAKSLLPKLFVSVLLINFSDVLAKVVIDFSQVFLFGIAGWMGSFSGTTGAGNGLLTVMQSLEDNVVNIRGNTPDDIIILIFCVLYAIVVAVLYNMLAVFLLVRLVMLVFLIIVSPFAFFSMVLPSTRGWQSKWFQSLWKNAIIGPVFIFFIYLSMTMMQGLVAFNTTVPIQADISFIGQVINVVVKSALPLAMLAMAIPAANTLGSFGARQITTRFSPGAQGMAAYAGAKLGGKGMRKGGGWAGRQAGVDTTVVRNAALDRVDRVANWAGGSSILKTGGVGGRLESGIKSRTALARIEDTRNMKKLEGPAKKDLEELSTEQLIQHAHALEDTKLWKGARLTPEKQASLNAAMGLLAERGENLFGQDKSGRNIISDIQRKAALERGLDIKKVATYDPIAAARMRAEKEGKGGDANLIAQYTEENLKKSGDLDKLSAHVREENLVAMVQNLPANKIFEHMKKASPEVQAQYRKGMEASLSKAASEAKKTGATQAEKDAYADLQNKIGEAFKDVSESHAVRDASGNKVMAGGKTVVDVAAMKKMVEKMGGNNLKDYNAESKRMYAETASAKQLNGVQYKGMGSDQIQVIADAIKARPAAIANALKSHEVLKDYL